MKELEEIIKYLDEKDEEAGYAIDHRYSDGYRAALRHVRNKVVTILLSPSKDK